MDIPKTGFGTPSSSGQTSTDPDDQFAGMGLPATPPGEVNKFANPIGIFDATVTNVKLVDSETYVGIAVEFELTDPVYKGEVYSLMAEKLDGSESRADAKDQMRGWQRIASAMRICGVAIDPQTLAPVAGWPSLVGVLCRLAVNEYTKHGNTKPSIVWGRPKIFDPSLKDARGRYQSYESGVLPAL